MMSDTPKDYWLKKSWHRLQLQDSSGQWRPSPLRQGSKLLPPHFCPKRCMHFVCFPPCFHEKPYILLSPTTFSRTHPASMLTLSGRPCRRQLDPVAAP